MEGEIVSKAKFPLVNEVHHWQVLQLYINYFQMIFSIQTEQTPV